MCSEPDLSLGVQAVLSKTAVRSGCVSHSSWIHLQFSFQYNRCSALSTSDTRHRIARLRSFSPPIV